MKTLHIQSDLFRRLLLQPQLRAYQPYRSFFTIPGTSAEPQTLTASRTLPYSAASIYKIIADVPQYSTFLPFCKSSQITRWSNPDENDQKWPEEAKIVVGYQSFEETFYSKIYCVPGSIVEAVGGRSRSQIPKEKIPHHNHQEVQQDKAADQRLITHLLTRWTVRPFPYLPPPMRASLSSSTSAGISDQGKSGASDQGDGKHMSQLKTDLPSREQTDVSLAIEFQFASPLYASMSAAAMPLVAGKIIEAFERRVSDVLGGPSPKCGNENSKVEGVVKGVGQQQP